MAAITLSAYSETENPEAVVDSGKPAEFSKKCSRLSRLQRSGIGDPWSVPSRRGHSNAKETSGTASLSHSS
jgi:hypothetical protein